MTGRGREGKIKVLFVIGLLDWGGTERVVVRILRRLDRARFRPVLLLIEKRGSFLAEVPEDVPILDCGRHAAGGAVAWMRNFVRFLGRETPDVMVSFLWFPNVAAVLARYLSGVPCRLILSERSTIDGSREGFATELARRAAIRLLYGAADRIVPNSDALGRQLVERFGIPGRKVAAMPNPVDIETIAALAGGAREPSPGVDAAPVIVGMGRLARVKGFDLLIRAMAEVRSCARLVLIGDGPEEGALRDLAGRLGVSERVAFAGFHANPYPVLANASVFVLPSRYEGFPNALVEAMALGLPCVASRCPTGPEEIVADAVNGLLAPVEDPQGLAAAINRLLDDAPLRDRLGRAARERARAYDAATVVRRFETILEEVNA